MKSFLLALAILATGAQAEQSMSYGPSEFTCFINECGCPGDFLKQWCSATTGVITAEWCNQSPENCNQCSGSVCYESDQPQDPPVTEEHHCYIDQCGCPGSFTEFWCSEDTAKITSPWCGESEEHCGMCGGSFCSADLEVIPVGPTGECFISQCGCPGSFKQEWCTETVAKITSEFCTFDEDHCGNHCAGTYCPVFNSYDAGAEGYCKSEIDDEVEPTASAEACWAQCAGKYPDTLVSIDWYPEDGGVCYCQDACDCMLDDPGAITLITKDLVKPEVCPAPGNSMSYSYTVPVYAEYSTEDGGGCAPPVYDEMWYNENMVYFNVNEPWYTADSCWNECYAGSIFVGIDLVSITWLPDDDEEGGDCYCFASCDCMMTSNPMITFVDDDQKKTLIRADTSTPGVCPAESVQDSARRSRAPPFARSDRPATALASRSKWADKRGLRVASASARAARLPAAAASSPAE